jgi:hypothetical protein
MHWLLSTAGVACAAVILALVARLSFLFWYTRGAMLDAELALPYGIFAAVLEVVKALAPFWLYAHYRARDYVGTAAASLILAAAVCVSFTSAAGLAAHLRLSQSAAHSEVEQSIASERAEIKQLEARQTKLGTARSVSEVEAAIASALAAPVPAGNRVLTLAAASKDCTRLTAQTAGACGAIATLRVELGQAREGARIEARIAALRRQIDDRLAQGKRDGLAADHQARLFAAALDFLGLGRASEFGVQAALIFLMATAFELCAGWVLYLTISHHRLAAGDRPTRRRGRGDVARFCAENIVPDSGTTVSLPELETAFADWCWQRGLRVPSRRLFRRDFSRIARRNGIKADGTGYVGIKIDPAAAEADLASGRG